LIQRLKRPAPRLDIAGTLAHLGVSSLIDSSDGFYKSVELICGASKTGADIWTERLPLSPALKTWSALTGRSPFDAALAGGEDYELVMTANSGNARRIESQGLATIVGRITPARNGLQILENLKRRKVPRGFEHFT
jgi:thiamine-monophosphate kinase